MGAFDKFLGRDKTTVVERPVAATGETETVRRLVNELDSLPPERARLVASAAATLARAANADLRIGPEETALIEQLLMERIGLPEAQAVLVAEMAKLQETAIGGAEGYTITRGFREEATYEQRVNLLRACYAIGAADGSITADENATVGQIGKELDVSAEDVTAIRNEFSEQMSVVQALRQATEGSTGTGGS
jgi:uncharacterized tellurite resistance protein B-like protein